MSTIGAPRTYHGLSWIVLFRRDASTSITRGIFLSEGRGVCCFYCTEVIFSELGFGLGSQSWSLKKKKRWSRCSRKVWRQACTYSDRRGKSKDWHSCGIQPTITYKTITQLHTGGVGSWKAGQMVNGIHSNNKEEATAAVHGCVTHWC